MLKKSKETFSEKIQKKCNDIMQESYKDLGERLTSELKGLIFNDCGCFKEIYKVKIDKSDYERRSYYVNADGSLVLNIIFKDKSNREFPLSRFPSNLIITQETYNTMLEEEI